MTRAASRRELAVYFLKLGLVAFGGPAAHIAMMEDEAVRRREWLSREKFLDLLGAANLIPGPTSTETAIYIGYDQAGLTGLFIAGFCFILPAAVIVSILAWAYVKYGSLPQVLGLLYGIKPVIIAVILQALWSLGRSAVKTKFLAVLGLVALALSLLGMNPLVVIFGVGSIAGLRHWLVDRANGGSPPLRTAFLLSLIPFLAYSAQITAELAESSSTFGMWQLFLVFLKVGSIIFGSGYVLLAFLQIDLVSRLHWITNSQLLDAITVGQVTPGPVFTTATFIGFLLGGPIGALVATVGIFAPAFVFVAVSGPIIPRLRKSAFSSAFLDGVIVGSLALMGSVSYILGRAAIIDLITATLAIASLILLVKFHVNSAWLVLLGAIIGILRVTL